MRSYLVMLPKGVGDPAKAGDGARRPRPEDFRLMPEGFSNVAVALPGPWLIAKGFPVTGVIALVGPLLVSGLAPFNDYARGFALLGLTLTIGVLTGMEGNQRIIERRLRKGDRAVGRIQAHDRDEAEDKLAVLATSGAFEPSGTDGAITAAVAAFGRTAPDGTPVAMPMPTPAPGRRYGAARRPTLQDEPASLGAPEPPGRVGDAGLDGGLGGQGGVGAAAGDGDQGGEGEGTHGGGAVSGPGQVRSRTASRTSRGEARWV